MIFSVAWEGVVRVPTHRLICPLRLRLNRAPRTDKGRPDIAPAINRLAFGDRGARLEKMTGVKIGEDSVAVERAEREVEGGTNERALE